MIFSDLQGHSMKTFTGLPSAKRIEFWMSHSQDLLEGTMSHPALQEAVTFDISFQQVMGNTSAMQQANRQAYEQRCPAMPSSLEGADDGCTTRPRFDLNFPLHKSS